MEKIRNRQTFSPKLVENQSATTKAAFSKLKEYFELANASANPVHGNNLVRASGIIANGSAMVTAELTTQLQKSKHNKESPQEVIRLLIKSGGCKLIAIVNEEGLQFINASMIGVSFLGLAIQIKNPHILIGSGGFSINQAADSENFAWRIFDLVDFVKNIRDTNDKG